MDVTSSSLKWNGSTSPLVFACSCWLLGSFPDFMDQLLCTVLVNCRWSREVRSKRFRTRQTAVTSGRVFLLLQFQFVQGLPGGGSVWRAAQMIRDPGRPRPGTGGRKQGGRHGGACGCGTHPPRECPYGWGQRPLRWTGPTALQSPCGEKGGVPTSTRTHPHTESAQHPRARITHVTHLRLARVPVALCYVSVCVCVARAQQCTAQCSANTRTYTTFTHTQHCHFTSIYQLVVLCLAHVLPVAPAFRLTLSSTRGQR